MKIFQIQDKSPYFGVVNMVIFTMPQLFNYF